jgi:ParB-like chromosome segregation protein Spo0J
LTTETKREDNARFHPLANVFPLMDEDAFAKLVEDIEQNGLTDPIIMLDGKILDGRNRWLACQQLGIAHREVKFDQLKLGTDDPAAFVWSHNAMRRHLTPGQLSLAFEELATLGWGQKPQANGEIQDEIPPKTMGEVAKEAGVSRATLAKARVVKKKGTPKVAKAVKDGSLTINAAERIAQLPADEQEEIMADPKPETAAARKEQARQKRTYKGPGPAVVMKGHMTGHQSGVRDVQLIHKFWAENAAEIDNMDADDLRTFIKDLEESRRAASQLLTLLAEKLVPEWKLEGKQPALLSTALNKIDAAAKSENEEGK